MVRNGGWSLVGALLSWSVVAHADPWTFGERLPVTAGGKAGTFHHLESAGRKNVAVSGGMVAVIWEDNRSGVSQVYVAYKLSGAKAFSHERRVSAAAPGSEKIAAYEPVIAALPGGRFLMGWEQGDAVWARTGGPGSLDPPVKLSSAEAGQIALAARGEQAYAAWAQRQGRFRQIVATALTVSGRGVAVKAAPAQAVDTTATHEQLYPSVVMAAEGVTLAWEDRRHGHTVLLTSHAKPGKRFGAAKGLNELVQKSSLYGAGNGVMRVTLAAAGAREIAAVWLDKRGYSTGYDVYGATSRDGGQSFGKNQMVQDSFGDNFTQWHPAVDGNSRGDLVVVWDDDRDGSPDILMSWRTPTGWHENTSPLPASGDGLQTSPSIAVDAAGDLHLVWVDSPDKGKPTALYYSLGRRNSPTPGAGVR